MTEKRLPENYERVLRLIPLGNERPRTGPEIGKLLNLSPRGVKKIINKLIINYGIAIVGERGNLVNGYYIPTDDSERLAGIRQLDKQVREEQRRIEALMYADLKEHEKYLKEVSNV